MLSRNVLVMCIILYNKDRHFFFSGCLQIACVIMQKDLKSWFAELNVDIDKIQEISRYIINLFELWKSYDEKKEIQGLINKMPKPKLQSTR